VRIKRDASNRQMHSVIGRSEEKQSRSRAGEHSPSPLGTSTASIGVNHVPFGFEFVTVTATKVNFATIGLQCLEMWDFIALRRAKRSVVLLDLRASSVPAVSPHLDATQPYEEDQLWCNRICIDFASSNEFE
jgi:hypothetical protein